MYKKISLLLLLSLVLVSCNSEEKTEIKKNYKIVEVGTGIVNTSNNFIGYTKGISQAMLATKSPGRITYMGKKIGDKVYAGEFLASLDGAEAKSGYNTANKIVNHLISIKNKTAKAFDEQIKAMQTKTKSVEAQIIGVNTGLDDTQNIVNSQIETAKTGVETAKLNLEETKKTLKIKKENIITGAKSAITQNMILNENIIDFSDKILGVTKENENFNDRFENYLGKKNSSHLYKTEEKFRKTKKEFNKYKTYYTEKIDNKNPSELEIIDGLKLANELSEKEKSLLKDLYDVMDYSIDNVYFSIETINNYKNQISTLGSNLENSLLSMSADTMLGIKGSLENISNFESEKNKGINLLEKQVELAEKTLKNYETSGVGQINSVKTKKEIAGLGLQEIKAGIEALKAQKEAQLREIDTKIAEAIGQRDQSSIMISNGKIIAPFSGIVTNKMSETGQITNAGMPLYEIADNKKIKLKISVPVSIILNLKEGEKLDVNIESLNKTFIGIITNISLSANPITKKYEVELIIENKNFEIPVGAMAIISFNTDFENNKKNKINSLRIPNSAIIEKFMVPGVYVLNGKIVEFKKIKIVKMGEFFSEIEGLNIGEKVITNGKENIFPGEILK